MEHWAKNILGKICPKTSSKHVWTLLVTIFGFFGTLKIFGIFLKIFEDSTLHGKLGKNFSKKMPQNTFRTRLDTFGTDFGPFWNFKLFLIFLKIFEDSTFHGKLGKNFSKNLPQNMFQTLLFLLGTVLCVFGWNFENFLSFFEKFRRLDTPWKTGQKFFEKFAPKLVQNTFEYFWERFWAFLEFWNFFDFFENFWKLDHPWNTGQKIFEKIAPKHVQNTFGFFCERFWAFLEFWNFFDFFENFRRLDPPWKTGQKIFGKFAPKHVPNTFGFFWERFCAFLVGILKIFWVFLKSFEDLTLHGKLGKNFSKNLPQNLFKTRLNTFGNDFGHFWNFEIFLIFFENFGKLEHPWNTGQKIFEKIAPKHVQNTFGFFCERFWAFLEFWKYFFLKIFENSTFHGKLGKNFSKNFQQNLFKTLLDSFGNGFVRFWLEFWKFFWVFLKSFEDSTLHGKLGKKIFKKFAPKHVQNTFGYFWERFWVFLEFWNFFDIFENFPRLDPPWITGHKIFQKIHPKTRSKHVWILLGTILGKFGKLRIFRFFSRFRSL